MKRCFVCFLSCFLITLCLTACRGKAADDSVIDASANAAASMPENAVLQTPESDISAASKKAAPSPEPEAPIPFSYRELCLEEENNEDEEWTFWDEDVIWINNDTLLCRMEYIVHRMGSHGFYREIIFTASSPDYVPKELMRINCENRPRLCKFIPLDCGAAFELDGLLYQYSANSGEIELLVDIKAFIGENYNFSPGSYPQNYDLSSDGERLLLCTDEGLYEYSLSDTSARLLVKSNYQTVEIEHMEGDCDCGEPGFTFYGPVYAEYAPDGQSIACLNGDEYGTLSGITLIDLEGNPLYNYETGSNLCEFVFFESDGASRLAVFDYIYNSGLSGYQYENTLQIIEPFQETVFKYSLPEKGFEKWVSCPLWLSDSPSGEDTLLYFDGCMKTFCPSTGKKSIVSPYTADFSDSFDDEATSYFAALSPDGKKVFLSQGNKYGFIISRFIIPLF